MDEQGNEYKPCGPADAPSWSLSCRVVMDLTVTVVESHCHLSLGKFRSFAYADDPRLLVVLNAFVLQDMGVYRH